MVAKKCSVPICKNVTDTPNKIFIHVPKNSSSQENWGIALKLPKSVIRNNVICEDHFDLQEDATNWMYYKMMGKKIVFKPGVVPHKYLESPPPSELPSSLSESARKRKLDTLSHYYHKSTSSTSKQAVVKNLFDEESPVLKKPKVQSEVPSPSG